MWKTLSSNEKALYVCKTCACTWAGTTLTYVYIDFQDIFLPGKIRKKKKTTVWFVVLNFIQVFFQSYKPGFLLLLIVANSGWNIWLILGPRIVSYPCTRICFVHDIRVTLCNRDMWASPCFQARGTVIWEILKCVWPCPADAKEMVNRVCQYLAGSQQCLQLPVGEVMVTCKLRSTDEESIQKFIPFINVSWHLLQLVLSVK